MAQNPLSYDILRDPFASTFEMLENGMNAPFDLTWVSSVSFNHDVFHQFHARD
jgi:hypothetical protein